MAKVPVAGRSYIEVDDADGVARNLSAFVEEVGPLGHLVSALDVTGLNDAARQVAPGIGPAQQFTLRGFFDDTPVTGSDAVLAGIVGKQVTVSYGPAGNGPGQRKVSGRFLCVSFQVGGRAQEGRDVGLVRFEARFQQAGPVTLEVWY